MSSWYYYSLGTRYIGDHTVTPEDRALEEKEWFEERLRDGKNLRKYLPVRGELNWVDPDFPPIPAILPKHAISRMGFINEIWVPGDDCELRIGDQSYLGVYQDLPIGYTRTRVRVYRGPDTDILLLSYKKLKIVPYIWKD